MGHLTELELTGYRMRDLAPDTLLRVAGHLAECDDCRMKLRLQLNTGEALTELRRNIEDHFSVGQLQAFVDGELEAEEREQLTRHMASCADCASDVKGLREFAKVPLRSANARRASRSWWMPVVAAAALAIIALGLWLRRPTVVVALEDTGNHITLDSKGKLSGVEGLSEGQRESIRRTLRGVPLAPAVDVGDLRPPGGSLMGAAAAPGFHLSRPIGTAVRSARPNLQWSTRGPGATYIVTLKNMTTGAVISSPPLSALEWTPTQPLQPGAMYEWQVAASLNGNEQVAPSPPRPQARFLILSADVAAGLENLPHSHLVRATLEAEAGLLDDAEHEAEALAQENPKSNIASELLGRIQALQKKSP